MKTLMFTMVLLSLLISTGCIFTTKPHHDFPKDIYQMCYKAKYEAKTRIDKINPKLTKSDRRSVLRKHAGEVKIDGMWAWSDPRWPDYYIGGYCNGTLIYVGCHPETKGEVSYGVCVHEFGHHWLFMNGGSKGHPVGFESVFGFADSTRMMRTTNEWILEAIDWVDGKGRTNHIDILWTKKKK